MATLQEIVAELTVAEKANLKATIEISLTLFARRKIQYDKLALFVAKRKDRVSDIVQGWDEIYASRSIPTEYAQFQELSGKLYKKDTTLDDTLGAINKTIYGEVKSYRTLVREKQELLNKVAFIGEIKTLLTNLEDDINELYALL